MKTTLTNFASLFVATTASKLESMSLAQLFLDQASSSKIGISRHTCSTTASRNKKEVANFFELVLKDEKYSDPDFTPDKSSMDWVNMKESALTNQHK